MTDLAAAMREYQLAAYDESYPPSLYTPPTPPGPSTAHIDTLVPATAVAGAVPLVTINGTGFTPGSVVRVNGVGAASTFVSATQMTTTALTGRGAGTYQVTVGNPSEDWSNAAPFVVTITAARKSVADDAPADPVTDDVTSTPDVTG